MSRFALLFFLTAALAVAVPRLTTVEPDAVSPGAEVVANGKDLAKSAVEKLFLTAGGKDIELTITEQTEESIKFVVPDGTEMKRYRLMFLTAGASPAYMEQPVSLEIVDGATAAERAEQNEAEVEIIDTPAQPAP